MHLLNQLLVAVMVISFWSGRHVCMVNASEGPSINTDIVDLALVIDMIPRHVDFRQSIDLANSRGYVTKWVKTLISDQHLGNSLASKNMRMAIVTVGLNDNVNPVVQLTSVYETLDRWTGPPQLQLPSNNELYDPASSGAPNTMQTVVNDIKIKNIFANTNSSEEGGRPFAPDVMVFMGIHPKKAAGDTRDVWLAHMKNNFGTQYDDFDVIMLVTDWIESGDATITNATKGLEDPDTVPNFREKFVDAIKNVLGRCQYNLNESHECYYKSKDLECVRDITYKPAEKKPTDDIKKFCLNGKSTPGCKVSFCKATCAEMDSWTTCSCNSSTQNLVGKRAGTKFEHCPASQAPTSRPCTPSSCPPAVTDPDADAPMLSMPVWAVCVCVCVFCVVVILDVVLTLLVYYGCFPPPKNLDATSGTTNRSRFQRFDDTMRSFMPSARSRAGGRSMADQSRGRSMAPSQMRPDSQVSRARR